jgi:hypothetical protein
MKPNQNHESPGLSLRITIVILLLFFNLSIAAQVKNCQLDTLNIPVILVDGVEVQKLDSIDIEDIIEFKVIKDRKITELFAPRLGGVMCITTKSKRHLTPIIQNYKKNVEAADKKKKQNIIYVR